MESNIRCSVVIATYNGEKYIQDQIKSILININDSDEIVISDDGSIDKTLNILKDFNDKRIKIFDGPKKGVKQNFANAISKASGKYIFLCDQDDVWNNNKVDTILSIFNKEKCSVVLHDAIIVNENLEVLNDSFFEFRNSKEGVINNIIKNSYIGCCMAFDRNITKYILPIPNNIEMHDQWIGIIGDLKGTGTVLINDKLIKYRRHGNNVSSMEHYGLFKMIENRFLLIFNLIKLRREK